ncbi:MAG: spore germination protein GerW family protein [Acidobacteria bacterium]|nr:spore germination protein GerW family protein [Acidobacteriota bacterium]MDA1233573.1 spore germination protein GerW family protein [Acidobacteriota bacterium]
MNATEMLGKIGESLASTATVRSVFGEPIHAEGKTIIPVAKVAYGFGAGGGPKPSKRNQGPGEAPDGGGGGGGVRAFPAGALEITQAGTRFVPFTDYRLVIGVFTAGFLLGGLFLRGRH